MLIQTVTGNENFQRSSSKVQVYLMPQAEGLQEIALGSAARDSTHDVRRQSVQMTPAAPGLTESFGKWMTARYEVDEGAILKVFAQRKSAEQVAGRHVNAAMLLHMRETGPLIRIVVTLTQDPRASNSAVFAFEGRADILTVVEATAAGAILNSRFLSVFGPDNQSMLFDTLSLAPETQPVVVIDETAIRNSTGEEVVVTTRRRRRALDL